MSTLPKWMYELTDFDQDVAKHLEVDYLTLSAFFLIDPLIIESENLIKRYTKKTLVVNMYN